MAAQPISQIVIAGGGIVAWSAAAALRRKIPLLQVTVIATDPPADALADRLSCTLPSIVEFHSDIGLRESDTVLRAGSGFRLGTRFEGWATTQRDYVHGYGEYGRSLAASPFYQHWLRARDSADVAPFDAYCSAAQLAAGGLFHRPQSSAAHQPIGFAYGLHIDPASYHEMMRAYALHLGVQERRAGIANVQLRAEDGFIESVILDDGNEVSADLFIDATGPAAQVRSRLNLEREDWTNHFLCDRILIAELSADGEASSLDRAVAFEAGWHWEASSPVRRSSGLVYSSSHLSDDDANRMLEGGERIELSPGRFKEPWLRNCLAIGDAAVAIEPLEWTNLHLAHSAIDRLVAMMPDTGFIAVELWDYNRQASAEADRVRDFVQLHYAVSNRPNDAFWRESSARPLPQSLGHTLTQFRERGRLPFYEEETFSRDSWAAVLIGQGVYPRRTDPLLDEMSPDDSARAMRQIRDAIRDSVEQAPTHTTYLRSLAIQESR